MTRAIRPDRRRTVALALVLALALGACGGDDDAEGAGGSGTADTGGDSGASAATAAPEGGGTGSGEPEGGLPTGGMDPEIIAIAELPEAEFCGLLTRDDVVELTGVEVDEGDFTTFEGLGTNCLYTEAGTFETVAKHEVGFLSWSDYAGLVSLQLGDDAPPPAEPCEVDGREALCSEPFTDPDGILSTGFQVAVKLGTDADPYLLVEMPDQAAAIAAAERILSRLG